MMCGLRMMLAGVLLYLWSWARGERNLPTRKDLSQSFVLAFFMVFMASGFLAKGQESISSGTAAMILGAVPIWMVARRLAVLRRSPAFVSAVLRARDRLCGPHPSQRQSDGLRHGLRMGHPACTVRRLRLGDWLVPLQKTGERDPAFRHTDERPVDVHRRPAEPRGCRRAWGVFHVLDGFRHSAERGGAALSGHLWGDHRLHLLFLAVAAHPHPVVAISYEYVNPVIGVFLGWLLAGEQVDGVIVTACCLTVLSVFFIVSRKHG